MYRSGCMRVIVSKVLQRQNATATLNMTPLSRGMFTDEYLGLDTFKRKRNSILLMEEGNKGRREFLDGIGATFQESGMKNIFSDDLVRVLDLAETEDDVALASKMLRAGMAEMESGGRDMPELPKYISLFFSLCMVDNNVATATEMWMSDELKQTGFEKNLRNLRVKYMTMMYKNGLHQDVVDTFKSTPEELRSLDDTTLVLAALYQLGTDDAFKYASEVMAKTRLGKLPREVNSAGFRGMFIYAYFAVQRGELGLAYDILVDKRRSSRSSMFSSNLKLLILTKVVRLNEALQVIKLEMLPGPSGKRKVVCFEVIQGLAAAIKDADSSNSELGKEFTALCKKLDESSELCEQSMEEMLLQPLEKYSRSPPRDGPFFDKSGREPRKSVQHEH